MTIAGVIASICVLLVGLTLWVQRRLPLLQYLYLGRYSLLSALLLIGLAPLSIFIATGLLQNLFILSQGWEIALVTWLALLNAWVVMLTSRLLLSSIPHFFLRMPKLALPEWSEGRLAALFALAALPIMAGMVWLSTNIPFTTRLLGVGVGLVVAFGVRAAMDALLTRLARTSWWVSLLSLFLLPLEKAGYPTARNAAGQRLTAKGHEGALGYFLLTLVVYVIGYFVLRPDQPWINTIQMPALAYLLLLLILLGWLLPGVALYLDRVRVPTSVVLLLTSFLFWAFINTDYYYGITFSEELQTRQSTEALTPIRAFDRWHEKRPIEEYPTMVIVTTSGGGIKAAYWTTQVLTMLQQEIGEKFSSSIALITAASGGSVGAMYFVDAYTAAGAPPMAQLAAINEAAASPSLAATAWGIIYPDFWRAVFAVAGRWNPLQDRGWALEQTWAQRLVDPQRTFGDWRVGIAAGWRPPVIFNTTIVETGERLLMTPLDQGVKVTEENVFSRPRYFSTLYPGYDIPVVTAARLSATFPYVSPVARAIDTPDAPDYHLADGGYYDNFGVVSALEWLNTVLPHAQTVGRRKILLIQIEASAFDEDGLPPPTENAGWLYNLAGPAITALNVQTTAQQQRNNMEFQLFYNAYKGVQIRRVKFTFGDSGPLSWQLSPQDITAIAQDLQSPKNQAMLAQVKSYFAGSD
ncbi:MAG: patatin-like phospholipase family protein [Caldilinea sp. CFX5]|nr:patatin-like phospholipase family protein [Caldilinea sp. CFX5]